MDIFKDEPGYFGLVVFNSIKNRNKWLREVRPSGWKFRASDCVFVHDCGAIVRLFAPDKPDDVYDLGGVEINQVEYIDEPDGFTREFIASRIRMEGHRDVKSLRA